MINNVEFQRCLALVLSYEGGFSNDLSDHGGATNLGITRSTLEDFCGRSCSIKDVRSLTRIKVEPIYRDRFWNLVQGDLLPVGVSAIVFDGAVNQGVGGITRILQEAVGVEADGALGPLTLKAVSSRYASEVIAAVQAARIASYRKDAGFARFGTGWLRRVNSVAATALSWAGARA